MHQRTCIDFGLNVCIVFCYSQLSPLALTFGNILVQIYARLCHWYLCNLLKSHWLNFNWGQNVYKPWALPRQHQFFSEDSSLPLIIYRCNHCPAVFTNRRQWRRHSRTHTPDSLAIGVSTSLPPMLNCSNIWQHTFATTSSQTGPAGSSPATRVLTPTKHRAKRVIRYTAYKAVKMEDLLGLLEFSNKEGTSNNDPRGEC